MLYKSPDFTELFNIFDYSRKSWAAKKSEHTIEVVNIIPSLQ